MENPRVPWQVWWHTTWDWQRVVISVSRLLRGAAGPFVLVSLVSLDVDVFAQRFPSDTGTHSSFEPQSGGLASSATETTTSDAVKCKQ